MPLESKRLKSLKTIRLKTISAEIELVMLAAYEISTADVGNCPSCHHSFQAFKPNSLNHWYVVIDAFNCVTDLPSDLCRQASFFYDASEDTSLEAAKNASETAMLELLQRDQEVSTKQFKYLWAVYDSSWEYGVHDEMEQPGKSAKKVTNALTSTAHNSTQIATSQASFHAQHSIAEDKRTSPSAKGRLRNDRFWYCCECCMGPMPFTMTLACVACGHLHCLACTLDQH